MRHACFFILLFGCTLHTFAQTAKEKLVGDWKAYLPDKINFEFLKLNADGTGVKCFGQTRNQRDSLFLDHVTSLVIKKWSVEKAKLTIQSEGTLSFDPDPTYTVSFTDRNHVSLHGEHLIYHIYPSRVNREDFQRTVNYQRAQTNHRRFWSKHCSMHYQRKAPLFISASRQFGAAGSVQRV